MSELTGLTAAGSGLVGVILPDTTLSSRYVDFDAPYLTKAFTDAGYGASDFKIDNAQGNDATELALAQADITLGAKVLIVDPLDSTVRNQIQSAAAAAGVKLISYDRATFQGTDTSTRASARASRSCENSLSPKWYSERVGHILVDLSRFGGSLDVSRP